jgi:predicted ATPase
MQTRELPTGTVTFLFTDIEGSTRLLHELGDAYADALAEHREVLREAFARHGGVEVDSQGDAFFVAFERASDALAAARDVQAVLEGPVRVRMGIHTGEPIVTEDGYVGIDIHRAARIAAVGHGGQVLMSQSTRELVGADSLRDLGEHRLKDLTAPERIYQVGDSDFPPLKSLNATNLPRPQEPLVGRRKELADILRLMGRDGMRLVTVTGPGGVGKTRFAVEAAGALVSEFSRGVWFVDLAPLRDPELVVPTIARTLGAHVSLVQHIGEDELLLVLDNCEQVIDAAQDVASLLAHCPRLAVLATSREPLHLKDEREYALRPLSESPAIELFQRRAEAVHPAFSADYDTLREICRRLDSLPLALELAAARVKVVGAEELRERLDRRLPLLVGRVRDLPPRQRALRATIEWSYELLSPAEQDAFNRLAVFSGGWTVNAAEAVCEADLDGLDSLLDKNLIRFDGARYAMLETIREFAYECFEVLPAAEQIRRRHAEHFCALAAEAEPELTGAHQAEWVARLATDHENLRTTLTFAERAMPAAALSLTSSLVIFWYIRSLYVEGAEWLRRALAVGPETCDAHAKALWGLGLFRTLLGDLSGAREPLETSFALADASGDDSIAGRAQSMLGLLAFFVDDVDEARARFEESASRARRAADTWCLADALGTLASIYPLQGDLELAEDVGREGLAIARTNRDEHGMRMALFGLGVSASRSEKFGLVRERASEGLAISRALGDLWFTSYFLWLLADAAIGMRDLPLALREADESVEVAKRIDSPLLLTCALEVRGRANREGGNSAAAARDVDDALLVADRGGVPRSYIAAASLTRAELLAEEGAVKDAVPLIERAERLALDVRDVLVAERARRLLLAADSLRKGPER